MLATINASLDSIPAHTQIGLISMTNVITVFDLSKEIQMVVTDLTDLDFPILPKLPTLQSCRPALSAVLNSLASQRPSGNQTGHCLGHVLAFLRNFLVQTGGLVVVGFAGLPAALPPRKVKPGDDDAALLTFPADGSGNSFRDTGFGLNRACVSVHIFTSAAIPADLPVTGIAGAYTCGSLHCYADLGHLHGDLFAVLTDSYLWQASMRLRCPKGISPKYFYSNCVIRPEGLLSFPVVPRSHSIGFGLEVTGDLPGPILFQAGLVFTDGNRRRIIRVFSFSCPVSADFAVVQRGIDEAALANAIGRQFVWHATRKGPAEALEATTKLVESAFGCGIKFKTFHHLMHAFLSNPITRLKFSGGIDARFAGFIRLRALGIVDFVLLVYPRLFAADGPDEALPLTAESFGAGRCFVAHTIGEIFVWIGQDVSDRYLSEAFGVSRFEELPREVPVIETAANERLNGIIRGCWELSGRYLPVSVVPQGDPREAVFGDLLVDDAVASGRNLADWIRHFGYQSR
jgi:hypothetical protein